LADADTSSSVNAALGPMAQPAAIGTPRLEPSGPPGRDGLPAGASRAPGPRLLPLVGDLGGLRAASNVTAYLERNWRRYGDTYRIKMMGTRAVVAAHPDALKHILSSQRANYVKGSAYSGVRRVLGDGLVTMEGDAWKARRALAQPAFHRRSLEKLTALMTGTGATFFEGLEARAKGAPLAIDAHREMVRLTLDVVVRALFGQALDASTTISYEAMGAALEVMSEGTNGLLLPAWVPTPYNLKFNRTVRALDAVVHEFIASGRRRPTDDGSLLSMLLSATDETGVGLSDRAVRDDVVTLFIAGHETTALTMTWMFTLLDGRPDVLGRMREEVDGVLGGRDPDFTDVPKLAYLRQVVDEALRLRPPAPMVARNAVSDDQIGGYGVHGGEMVILFFYGTHRHPDFWSNPEAFDPDRFGVEQSAGRNSWSYLPFSGGPRTCIGNMFSLIETVVLVAQMMNRFDIEVLSCADVTPVAVGTLRPSHPVRLVLHPKGRA
jgi:cytochrome P450